MMTREEAIKLLKQYQGYDPMFPDGETLKHAFDLTDETVDTLITALRTPTREQVEKVFPGCDYCKHAWMEGLDLKPCASGKIGVELTIGRVSEDDAFGILAYYRNTAAGYIDFPFCPFCGAPMTDAAVEIVMERINEMEGMKK